MNGAMHGAQIGRINIGQSHMNSGLIDDELSDPSSPESGFDASDLLQSACNDDITAQLAASGPVGVAAAAAIATGKRKGHPHHFEINPSRRKRQQTRLLRKLKNTIDEYTTRVGQQAVVLCCTPNHSNSQSNSTFKVFGSQPLENVIRTCRQGIMHELESSLQDHAPLHHPENAHLHELPPLVVDGIPTPINKMTQAQLRNFIPEMLKYSTGRSKPGWGKPECRPVWWPGDLPWANVRSDARTDEDKKRVSWTDALRTIVKNCYRHHGRDDLLHVFSDEISVSGHSCQPPSVFPGTVVQTINNPDGSMSIIHIDTGSHANTNTNIITLPDGTQATVVHAVAHPQEECQAMQNLAGMTGGSPIGGSLGVAPISIEMGDSTAGTIAALSGATFGPNGQLIFTGDGNTGGISGIVTIPASVYQSVTSLTPHIRHDAMHVSMPMFLKTEVPDATQAVEVTSMDPSLVVSET